MSHTPARSSHACTSQTAHYGSRAAAAAHVSAALCSGPLEVVASVGDVDAAIRTTRGHKPDVLVLDLNMPGANGAPDRRRVSDPCPEPPSRVNDAPPTLLLVVQGSSPRECGNRRGGALSPASALDGWVARRELVSTRRLLRFARLRHEPRCRLSALGGSWVMFRATRWVAAAGPRPGPRRTGAGPMSRR